MNIPNLDTIDHVMWDWNGTLLNDVELTALSCSHVFEHHGLEVLSTAQFRKEFHFPVRSFYEKRGFDFSMHCYDSVSKVYIKHYSERVEQCNLHVGAQTLMDLFEKGKSQSIVSAHDQDLLMKEVGMHGLSNRFTDIVGLRQNQGGCKRDAAKGHLQQLDIAPDRILFIGDTMHDFEVAQDMGCQCILVAEGYCDFDRIKSLPVSVFPSFEALLGLINQEVA